MISTTVGSRIEIKKNLNLIFDLVEKRDYTSLRRASDKLRFSIQKYFLSKGKEISQFEELFSKFNFTIIVHSNYLKTEALLENINEILIAIRTTTENVTETLEELYEEILELYFNINQKNALELRDCFHEIRLLRKKMRETGGESWIYYCNCCQYLSVVEASMLRLTRTQRITTTQYQELELKFSDLLTSINSCIAPPTIDDSKIFEIYKNGVSIRDISHGLNIDEKEIINKIKDIEKRDKK